MKTKFNQIKNIALISFVLLLSGQALAQNSLQRARQMVVDYEYQKAIDLYNDYFSNHSPAIDDARSLAQCYMMINDPKSATEWMAKVVEFKTAKSSDKLIYANLLKSEGKYDEAIEMFNEYKVMRPDESDEVDKWIDACNKAKEWIANPDFYDVSNSAIFNTSYSEFGLIPFEKAYIITTDRKLAGVEYGKDELYKSTGNPFYKLIHIKTDKNLKGTKEISKIEVVNNEFHNGPAVYDKENKTLYFTRTKMVKVAKAINPDPTYWYDLNGASSYVNRLEIYTSKYSRGTWSEPEAFPYNKPLEYSIGHPAISPDGNILYFFSDMPGGLGSYDIYYCEKTEGGWSEPINAGSVINTSGKEAFPYISEDGILYFSSNGHPGLGGLDIFKSKGSKETWTIPENLKSPVNSPKDDFSMVYTEDQKSGFLASNRDGGKGSDDIYSFEYNPPKEVVLLVKTNNKQVDSSVNNLEDVDIIVLNKSTNKDKKYSTNEQGIVYITVPSNTIFDIKGKKNDFLTTMKTIETKCKTFHDTITVMLEFDSLVMNKPIVLKNIYYDFDKWKIRPDAVPELNNLITILNQNKKISIELGSHTDCRGSDNYNQFLSQKRAESAVTYIISRSINPKRITAKGYGESQLVNKCKNGVECTDEEHQLNRRTEFKITSVKKVSNKGKNIDEEIYPNIDSRPKYYTVQDEDTLYRIALMYNTTVESLKVLNSLENNIIKIGQKLTIY